MAGAVAFQKATKRQSKLRMALAGPAGSGKTMTGLILACALAKGGRVAVIDTERGSASKYSDLYAFDVLELEDHHPQRYVDAIHAAEQAGYAALLIDSLSHAWMGNNGALALVDQAAKRSQAGNTFGAWRDVTPLHNALVDAMLASRLHVIATLRSKQDHVQEKDERGRTVVRKLGMAPIQRDGLEYEFDVFADLDAENTLIVGKTRCSILTGVVVRHPDAAIAHRLLEWLEDGAAEPERPALSVVASDDQPQRDRPAASSSAATASKPAASVPAGVAQGEGAGGEDRQSVRRAASPPAQPAQPTRAVFQSDHPQGSVEWMWDQWRGLTAVAQGAGVKYADPPDDIDAATLGRWMQKLEQRIAEAAPF